MALSELDVDIDGLGGNRVSEAEVHGLGDIGLTVSLSDLGLGMPDGMVIERTVLDNALVEEAKRRGIDVMFGYRFVSMSENSDHVAVRLQHVSNGSASALNGRLLVGADGVNSQVRKHAGISPGNGKDTAIAIRAYADFPEESNDKITISWIEDILPGYGWCFPLPDGKANIGCGMSVSDYRKHKPDLKTLLSGYVRFPLTEKLSAL